jgi:transposase
VTLTLLWEEYARGLSAAGETAYKYTSFCVKYRAWARCLKRSMRQVHVAGERLFVDYAGQTVPLIDAATGEIARAQVFVAVLGASNYTFACATATQSAPDWVGAIIRALEFIGGVPRLIVPDQTRALIATPAPIATTRRPMHSWKNCARTTVSRCCRRAPPIRAISPRSRSPCRSSSAGSSRGCATGASSGSPSSMRRSRNWWSI